MKASLRGLAACRTRGGKEHLSELGIVNEVGTVPVDQGAECQAVLPAGRWGRMMERQEEKKTGSASEPEVRSRVQGVPPPATAHWPLLSIPDRNGSHPSRHAKAHAERSPEITEGATRFLLCPKTGPSAKFLHLYPDGGEFKERT